MAKRIETVVKDIYDLLGSGHEVHDDDVKKLSDAISVHIVRALSKREASSSGLRASQLGTICDRKSFYNEHPDGTEETPQPWVLLKFLFGHIHEELVLWLAEQAGHKVTNRQDTITIGGVDGHPDALIDGSLVDVKSANSRGMDKFRKNALLNDDPFGYITQLGFYRLGMIDLPEYTDKNRIHFLACDKEMGHLVLDSYDQGIGDLEETIEKIEHKKTVVALSQPPARHFMPEPDGRSGNMMLGLECRYCDHKTKCWPGLRKFAYSNGPRWLTKVVKEPDVPEIKD